MTHLDKNTDFGRWHEQKSWFLRAPSLATGHEVSVWTLKRAKNNALRGNKSAEGKESHTYL